MNTIQKYTPFLISALLMSVVLFIIYPHYQYYIDPDGTAYLTVSQRYADGDYAKAVNGLWSPWACWLTALLIKNGIAAIPASVVINALGAVGFLYISQSFFLKFNITSKLQWIFNITLALFLCYAIFWQSFDDLWGCFFLLCTLRLMLFDGFKDKPLLWIVCGMIGALAYFAKAYSFPYFILNTICCTWFISKDDKALWLKMSFITVAVMILCSLPWIYALHTKYGMWTTSTAGPLNLAWYLTGHPTYKEGIDLLLPPAYVDSPSYWEDPWFVNGPLPHFWDSWHLAGRELLRVGFNVYKLIICSLQLSVLFPFIAIVAIRSLLFKTERSSVTPNIRIIILSCMLLPLGYLLVAFESRYLWYMLPLAMILGTIYLQEPSNGKWQNLILVVFPITFLFYPAKCMVTMYNEGKEEYVVAQHLKQLNIHGAFTSMAKPGIESRQMLRLAYFSGNQLYNFSKLQYTQQNVLREMRRYHIQYFFVYGQGGEFRDEQGKLFLEIANKTIPGLKIFVVSP